MTSKFSRLNGEVVTGFKLESRFLGQSTTGLHQFLLLEVSKSPLLIKQAAWE